jgi:hypothetical protein
MNRPELGRLAAYTAVVFMFASGLWLTEHRFHQSVDRVAAEERARAVDQCEAGAETRRILRQMVREGGIASGIAGGEALILAVGDADPEVVDLYRAHLVDQLTPALERIVNELPDREWNAEAGECVDVAVGE